MKPHTKALTLKLLHTTDGYWRAADYLSVGQIRLYDNLLLKRPLPLADVKHMLLGHWGTTPGQYFMCRHLKRAVAQTERGLDAADGRERHHDRPDRHGEQIGNPEL